MKLVIKHNNEISTVEIKHDVVKIQDIRLDIKDDVIFLQKPNERITLSENVFILDTPYAYDAGIVRVKDMVSRYSLLKSLESYSTEWLIFNRGIFNINNVEVFFVDCARHIEIQVPDTARVYLEDSELKFDKVVSIERERVIRIE